MKNLVPMDDFGVFADSNATARASSLFVAQTFEKRHDAVLRDIAKITAPNSGLSREFNLHNFVEISYKDSRGRKQPAYAMTRDGFTILVNVRSIWNAAVIRHRCSVEATAEFSAVHNLDHLKKSRLLKIEEST